MFITDNHMHLRDEPVRSARRFQDAGGTHVFLCHLPYPDMPSWEVGYPKQYERTLSIARKVREETRLKVFVNLGPYPADLVRVYEARGIEAAEEHIRNGIDAALEIISGGEAVAMGEIGRPHFPVPDEVVRSCDRMLLEAMERAKDAGCSVLLHTESGKKAWEDMANLADRAGLPGERVIKHFSGPMVLEEENHGLFPSVLARRDNLKEALSKGTRFMMETDFLDDLKRPGAVLSPQTVPKKTAWLLQEGLLDERTAYRIHCENPEKAYGIDLD